MTLENLPAIARKTAANLHSSGRWEIMELLLERLASEIETQASELATLRRRVAEMEPVVVAAVAWDVARLSDAATAHLLAVTVQYRSPPTRKE